MKINDCKMCKSGKGEIEIKRRGFSKVYRVVCTSCENYGAQVESEARAIKLWNEQKGLFDEPIDHRDSATGGQMI